MERTRHMAAALLLALVPGGVSAQGVAFAVPPGAAGPAESRAATSAAPATSPGVAASVPVTSAVGAPPAAGSGNAGAGSSPTAGATTGSGAAADARGAPMSLTLRQALGLALAKSEEVRVAAARVDEAEAGVKAAKSAALPKVNTQLSYNHALRSPFQGSGLGLPDSMRFNPDPNASVEERLSYLEKNAPLAGLSGLSGAFGNLPFGKPNTWSAGVTVTQPLYAGGQIRA
ncbi:MAG: TolC family protein, partial [Gemmatimonadetes bacterium]|nr:TolC family protein [Gemmatimonadota bacterium]